MNTYRYILLHIDTLYGTIYECIPHGKDGQRVSYGRQASFSKGGRPCVRRLSRDGQAVVAERDCTRRQAWQTMAYQAKHARTSQGERNATRREQVNTLASSPVAPRLTPVCFQAASINPLCGATCLYDITRHSRSVKFTVACLYR